MSYPELCDYLDYYPEFTGDDFYRYIFPTNENKGEYNKPGYNPNAIFVYTDEKGKHHSRIMLNDTWDDDYLDLIECSDEAFCGGLAYRGRRNLLENAQRLHAFIIDLDDVGPDELRVFFNRIEKMHWAPMPTFLVCSGTGLHCVYVLDKPIDLFPNIKLQCKKLKYALTYQLWVYGDTSKAQSIQYQSINQGYRMVGSINKKYGTVVRAFKTGEPVSLAYLNSFVNPEDQVDILKPFRPSKMTREEAKLNYPEWYERVILKGSKAPKKWDIAGKVHGDNPWALYDWWKKQGKNVRGGHRYFYMMCLVIYGVKCDVPYETIEKDLLEYYEVLKKVSHSNDLTKADVYSALETYSKEYYNFTLDDIEKLCGWVIKRNKRNGQRQDWHLEDCRNKKATMKSRKQPFKNPEGRPKGSGTYEDKVREWRRLNPDGKKADCVRDLNLDKKTVYKWWNNVDFDSDLDNEYEQFFKVREEAFKHLKKLNEL